MSVQSQQTHTSLKQEGSAGCNKRLALSTVMRTLPSRAYSACQALLGPVPNAFFLVSFCSQHVLTVDADDANMSKAQIVYKDAVGPCMATAIWVSQSCRTSLWMGMQLEHVGAH